MLDRTISHYRIVAKIGAGGMGVVYRAHDEQLERDVALKVLTPGTLANETARQRFRREALALAKLNHPNIETVYEFGSEDGMDFLVMELITGVGLHYKLASWGPARERDPPPRFTAGRRPGSGTCARHHSSRPEAGQPSHHERRSPEDPGFWPGAVDTDW